MVGQDLEKLIGLEVFLACGELQDGNGELYITESFSDMAAHLRTLSPSMEGDTNVYHGILAAGQYLPNSCRGKSMFVIIQDPTISGNGCVMESDCTDIPELASEIQAALTVDTSEMFSQQIEIEDIFILYGYQLTVYLTIDQEDLDEEVIDTCETVAEEILAVEKASSQKGGNNK